MQTTTHALKINDKAIHQFTQMQTAFSADLLPHLHSGELAQWFSTPNMPDKAATLANIALNDTPLEQMLALCYILELEADLETLHTMLMDATA